MTARLTPVRQSRITRALKAVKAAGMPVVRVEIGPDERVIVFAGGEAVDTDDRALEEWSRKRARQA